MFNSEAEFDWCRMIGIRSKVDNFQAKNQEFQNLSGLFRFVLIYPITIIKLKFLSNYSS